MSEEEVDNTTDIIESEAIAVEDQETKPTIVKKGSFFAFVFATAALALSGYQYYLQHQVKPSKDTKPWQTSIQSLESKITTLQASSSAFDSKLQALQSSIETINNEKESSAKPQVFDDSELNQQILQIKTQLESQQNLIQQLQEKTTQKSQQNFQQSTVDPDTNTAQLQQNRNLLLINISLQSAQTQLNILGDVDRAKKALQLAIAQLNKQSQPKYSDFALELNTVAETLNSSKKVDLFGLNKQIDALEYSSSKLQFAQLKPNPKQETAWYDKLITIKKIDDSQPVLLTRSEQESIRQSLSIHFSLLRRALVGKITGLWVAEISQLQKMFSQYFASDADSVKRQLNNLKYENINPDLPDLSVFLQKFVDLSATEPMSE